MAFFGHIRPTARHLAVRRFAGSRPFYEERDAGLRVAHLSDQHVGRVTPDALQQAAIAAANDASPDLVLLTGDYVAYGLEYLDQLKTYLSAINARAFAVLGNHDHWADAGEIRRVLGEAGVEVLTNEWTTIHCHGDAVQIVGVDDAYTGHADVDAATRGLDRRVPTLALSHVGEVADPLWDRGASFVFSGHTHSGQIAVGGISKLALGRLGRHRYIHGLYGCRHHEQDAGALYVNAGIGSSRVSLRLGERARPEVAVFDLHTRPGSFDEHHSEQLRV